MTNAQLAILAAATVLYAAHAGLTLWQVLRRGQGGALANWGALAPALALHTLFLVIRGIEAGGVPIVTRLDTVALFLWVTAVVFLLAGRPYRLEGAAPVFWPLFVAGALAMWALSGRQPAPRAAVESLWLLLHLVPVYLGYAGFAVAAGAGVAYLIQERLLRRKGASAPWRLLPSLETLARVDRTALTLGFPILTVGLVVGALWAEQNSELLGHAWYTDPKVVGGAIVWVFYAVVIHARLFTRIGGRRAAWLTIAGFVLSLASFGVAHAYAPAQGQGPAAASSQSGAP